jgi:hypothetical protein
MPVTLHVNSHSPATDRAPQGDRNDMDSIIYLVGLIVIVMFVLGALGLR